MQRTFHYRNLGCVAAKKLASCAIFTSKRLFSAAPTVSAPTNPIKPPSSTEADRGAKIAVITGASSGIGMECAAVFSSLGWEVHNISRRVMASYCRVWPSILVLNRAHFLNHNLRRKPCPVEGVISHAADLTSSTEATRVGNIIAGDAQALARTVPRQG